MRWIFVLMLVIAACRPTTQVAPNANLVTWDRSPQTILFRADILGGESDFNARNAIPNCTIYGDNRIVWVNELGAFQVQVLEDRLPDATISAFVQHLTVDERIYTYEARLQDVQTQAGAKPVVETVAINVNGINHDADSLGGWDSAWFPRVLGACKALSPSPVLVAPSSGWVSAQSVAFSTQPPISTWDTAAMGISLASIAGGAPKWISGSAASSLWNTLHSLPSNLIFQEGSSYFQVALQVPGITRAAPAAPS